LLSTTSPALNCALIVFIYIYIALHPQQPLK
jgi:hypothetical protein